MTMASQKKPRQEIYTPRDQALLARLIHEIDKKSCLFSAKRDASMSEQKSV